MGVSNTVIDNCSFIKNSGESGSAIYTTDYGNWRNAKSSLTNCLFENNSASEQGGAISIVYSGNPKGVLIDNRLFLNNSARDKGGAIFISMNNTEKSLINNCTFVNNSVEGYGSSIHLNSDNANIINCIFEKNNGRWGVFVGGGNSEQSNNAVVNCSFINNTGEESPALYLFANYSIVKDCRFIGNTANSTGASRLSGSNNIFTNCTFINNSTQGIRETTTVGAIYISCVNGVLANSTFDNNYVLVINSENAVVGGAHAGAIGIGVDNVTVENCILIRNHVEGNVTYAYGGAVRTMPVEENITFKNCSFISNYIKNYYGTSLGSAFFGVSNKTTLLNCSFINNSAIDNNSGGGAVFFGDPFNEFSCNNSAIIDCIFENNYATGGHDNRYGDLGGGAIHYGLYKAGATHTIINSIFKNNKVPSRYLNFTEEDGAFKLSLEGYEKYMHAISSNVSRTDFNLILSNVSYWDGEMEPSEKTGATLTGSNVSYWDGEMLNSDDGVVESYAASNQPIVFEFYDLRGKLVHNITKITDSNGQVILNFAELTEGIYTYVIYHPDNAYYDYILGAEGDLRLRSSFSDLKEKIEQSTDSITLKGDYIYNSSTDSGIWIGININKNLTIYGDGHFINGDGSSRIFKVAKGVTLTLIDLTLNNTFGDGGAVYNDGVLKIINSTLSNNYLGGNYDKGGAIYNNGNLTIIGSTLTCDTVDSQDGGGAIYNRGSMKISDSILESNIAEEKGGAIYNLGGTVTIINSTLRNNTATREGSAIWTDNGEGIILDNIKLVDQGNNPIYSQSGVGCV